LKNTKKQFETKKKKLQFKTNYVPYLGFWALKTYFFENNIEKKFSQLELRLIFKRG